MACKINSFDSFIDIMLAAKKHCLHKDSVCSRCPYSDLCDLFYPTIGQINVSNLLGLLFKLDKHINLNTKGCHMATKKVVKAVKKAVKAPAKAAKKTVAKKK